jgi:hypothetical protein
LSSAVYSILLGLLLLSSFLDLLDDIIEFQVQHRGTLFGIISPPTVEALQESNRIDWAKGFCQCFDSSLSDLLSASNPCSPDSYLSFIF